MGRRLPWVRISCWRAAVTSCRYSCTFRMAPWWACSCTACAAASHPTAHARDSPSREAVDVGGRGLTWMVLLTCDHASSYAARRCSPLSAASSTSSDGKGGRAVPCSPSGVPSAASASAATALPFAAARPLGFFRWLAVEGVGFAAVREVAGRSAFLLRTNNPYGTTAPRHVVSGATHRPSKPDQRSLRAPYDHTPLAHASTAWADV